MKNENINISSLESFTTSDMNHFYQCVKISEVKPACIDTDQRKDNKSELSCSPQNTVVQQAYF